MQKSGFLKMSDYVGFWQIGSQLMHKTFKNISVLLHGNQNPRGCPRSHHAALTLPLLCLFNVYFMMQYSIMQ